MGATCGAIIVINPPMLKPKTAMPAEQFDAGRRHRLASADVDVSSAEPLYAKRARAHRSSVVHLFADWGVPLLQKPSVETMALTKPRCAMGRRPSANS